jgi:L-alanine-DL-glutamate epimerase-like enolase superfamily enzyme
VPDREHQTGPRGRAPGIDSRARCLCRTPGAGLAWRHARIGHRACTQSSPLHASQFPLPGDIAASRRYYAEDLIEPAIDVNPDGTVSVPDGGPGIGVHIVADRVDRATLRRTEIRAS